MIPITAYAGQKVAIFGLGGSGLASASALLAGGADVIGWDDDAATIATKIDDREQFQLHEVRYVRRLAA